MEGLKLIESLLHDARKWRTWWSLSAGLQMGAKSCHQLSSLNATVGRVQSRSMQDRRQRRHCPDMDSDRPRLPRQRSGAKTQSIVTSRRCDASILPKYIRSAKVEPSHQKAGAQSGWARRCFALCKHHRAVRPSALWHGLQMGCMCFRSNLQAS